MSQIREFLAGRANVFDGTDRNPPLPTRVLPKSEPLPPLDDLGRAYVTAALIVPTLFAIDWLWSLL